MMKKTIILILLLTGKTLWSQDAAEIIRKADEKIHGKSTYSEVSIQIIRPKWQREIRVTSRTKGTDYAVSLVTYPNKEKGIVFLKRKNEMWNYMPSIQRKIKMPPSMMLQSWMGTDLTNDDMVKRSSVVNDYSRQMTGEEEIQGLPCYKIELIPHEDAPVVWGKVILWIDKKDFMEMKAEFYDEDGFLVNVMNAYDPRVFDGRKLPSRIEFVPADKPGHKTVIRYDVLKFNLPTDDKIFNPNYMNKLKLKL